MVRVAGAGLEASAHSRLETRLAGVGHERGIALENVDELILLRVRMAQGRVRARGEPREVDAEVLQPEEISERPLLATLDARGEGLGVAGRPRVKRSEEHTSELQSLRQLVCRLL